MRNTKISIEIPAGYSDLVSVFVKALERASKGKGKERHAENKPFVEQDIVAEGEYAGTIGAIQQIRKKAKESLRVGTLDAQVNELLDVIVYAGAAVIILQRFGNFKIVKGNND